MLTSWIFLVEGLRTVAVAIVSYFVIINGPDDAKFLTTEERELLKNRLRFDGVKVPMNDEFQWKFVRQGK